MPWVAVSLASRAASRKILQNGNWQRKKIVLNIQRSWKRENLRLRLHAERLVREKKAAKRIDFTLYQYMYGICSCSTNYNYYNINSVITLKPS